MSEEIRNPSPENEFSSIFTVLSDVTVPKEQKMDVLTKFKGHVKKEFIDVTKISLYMDGLLTIHTESGDNTDLTFLGQSCLCYLIKRIGIQSPESLTQQLIDRVVQHLIDLHGHHKDADQTLSSHNDKKLWLLTIKVLESLYNINPVFLENTINNILKDQANTATLDFISIKIILIMMNELCQLKVVRDKNETYPLTTFTTSMFDIVNSLSETGRVDDTNTLLDIISDIIRKYIDYKDLQTFLSKIQDASTRRYLSDKCNEASDKESTAFDVQYELQTILKDAKGPPQLLGDTSELKTNASLSFSSVEKLAIDLETLLVPFEALKETEQNWKIRQQNITKIREIFNANRTLISDERVEFVSILKSLNFVEAISKTALSLRTTLSLNTCLLIKYLLQTLGDDLTIAILDHLFTILKSLLSSTKKLSSQMGYFCMLLMFIHTNFHNKLFQSSFLMINEKSVIQRHSSAIILRIMLIKSHNNVKFENNLLYTDEWIKKGISDAQTQVRESMRITFWYYFKVFPSSARTLLNNSFSTQLKKAIELSIPKHLKINYEKQYQTTYSNSSSRSGSRRSSLLSMAFQKRQPQARSYPSYAQPTQSSISQKSAAEHTKTQRSTSEFAGGYDNHSLAYNTDKKRLKANDSSVVKRKTSAPVSTKQYPSDTNLNQLDLTDELSDVPSIALVNKYMKVESPISQNEFVQQGEPNKNIISIVDKRMVLYDLLSDSTQYEEALKLMASYFLDSREESLAPIDFDIIKKSISTIITEHPLSFSDLLTLPEFLDHISIYDTIVLLAINDNNNNTQRKNVLEILKLESPNRIKNSLEQVNTLLGDIATSTDPKKTIFYLKYRTKIYNFALRLLSNLIQNDVSDDQITGSLLRDVISTLFKIYGNEFDSTLYFNAIYVLYQQNKDVFIECLRQLQFISVKLKIAQELQKKDTTFELNSIILNHKERNDDDSLKEELPHKMSSNSLSKDNTNLSHTSDAENILYNDDTEVKQLLEMTMINPFNQKRSTSGNSVIHNKNLRNANAENDEAFGGPAHNDMTITDPRLYEMTKIVSLYQNGNQPIVKEENKNVKDTQIGDSASSSNHNSMLSDIFQGNDKRLNDAPPSIKQEQRSRYGVPPKTEKDHTVTFSDFPVEISSKKENERDQESHLKNTNTILPKYEATSLQASRLELEVQNSNENINKSESSVTPVHYHVLQSFSNDPITIYELAKIISRKKSVDSPTSSITSETDFQHLQRGLLRIKSGTFTLKHLNYLIEPLVMFNLSDTNVLTWLRDKGGYNEVLSICLTLLQSTDDATLLPTTMTRKAILLIQCTLTLNKLNNESLGTLSKQILDGIWDQISTMVDKIGDFSNEIYLLLCETRNTLIEVGFFKPRSITAILNTLVTELPEDDTEENYRNEFNETRIIGQLTTNGGSSLNLNDARKKIGLKQSFMLNTIICVLKTHSSSFKDMQFAEIIQTMSYFVDKTNADWRYNSISVAVEIYKILRHRGITKPTDMDNIFGCLDRETYKLIKIMGNTA